MALLEELDRSSRVMIPVSCSNVPKVAIQLLLLLHFDGAHVVTVLLMKSYTR